jgi:flavorubredoxin
MDMSDLISNQLITPLPLVPGKLYRLGGVVPIDGRLSWRRAGLTGYEPISAFLLLEDDNALIVGTGVRLHRELIIAQIRSLIGNRQLHIYAGRNEADEIGNLAALVKAFKVKDVWFAGAGHLLKWFEHDDFDGKAPGAEAVNMNFIISEDSPGRRLIREFNRPTEVAFAPNHKLRLINTRLTVLGFSWLYDGDTKTLFCSDFFSEGKLDFLDQPAVMPADMRMSLDEVRNHIFTRFQWMADADTAPLIEDLKKFFELPIERLAPYHGLVIEGEALVRHHLDLAIKTLQSAATFSALEHPAHG